MMNIKAKLYESLYQKQRKKDEKIILSAILSSLFVYGQTSASFEDLYGKFRLIV